MIMAPAQTPRHDSAKPYEEGPLALLPVIEGLLPVIPQAEWARSSIASRLKILKRARHLLAGATSELCASISTQLSRTHADTMVSEILPLLEAIRFLERQAKHILRPRPLGRSGRPFWLFRVNTEIERVPFGKVLVVGPSNYPLFLPGVQVFQALAAGNSAIWKPGLGAGSVARIVAHALSRAGLPDGLLSVTDDTIEAAQTAIVAGVDKVFFTGSGAAGKALLRQLAETATPCVVELSGNDAAVVLPSADLSQVVAALAFGMRLNGSATCMAPRRILLVDFPASQRNLFVEQLTSALSQIEEIALPASARRQLAHLISDAQRDGATAVGNPFCETIRPLLLLNATPEMQIALSDIFAPVLTLIEVEGTAGILRAQQACPLALTTSIFGEERAARLLAGHINTGTITINDLIVPTADPRVPFGGRRQSGFGVTRGAEGLLEMTAVKVIATRRGRRTRHFDPTGETHAALFHSIITAAHASRIGQRWSSLKRAFTAAMELKKK